MAQGIKLQLKNRLKGAKRVAVLGIGSELMADDSAGMLLVDELNKCSSKKSSVELRAFFGSNAPENLTGEIKRFSPTHLLIVDAAQIGKKPGEISFFSHTEDLSGVSFCTHRLPINVMTDYLLKFCPCDITLIGIQPKTICFGTSVSSEVKKATKQLSLLIREAVLTPPAAEFH